MSILDHLKAPKKKKIHVTELLLRDAHQSLLATRMRLEDMLPICEQLDKVGYHSLEVWGGATFDSCLRFLDEDPWVRLRELKKALPKTPLQMLLRGQNILGYRHYADDVVERFVHKSIEYGMNIFRTFDALNDLRNIEKAVKCVLKGGGHAQGAICYTMSPVHTLDLFVEQGRQLESMGCQSIVIKDMAALLCPVPAYQLVKALKAAVKIPVHVHTHSTTGVAPMVLVRAVDAGADGVDTAISTLSGGSGHVATEALVETLAGTDYDTGLKQEDMAPIAEYVRKIRPKYKEFETNFSGSDTRIFLSQIPGGMISNLESQLKQMGALDKLDEVMHEIPKVRAEMGFIPLVTPTSQIVGTQAVFNVIMKERYKTVPAESRDVFAGKYGKPPIPVDKDIQKKVLGDDKPITCRPADLIPNEFDKLRAEIADRTTDEDQVLSYALFPKVWPEFWKKKTSPPAPAAEAKPAAAPAPAPAAPAPAAAPANGNAAPVRQATLEPGRRMALRLKVGGRVYDSTVEVV
ncbi:MAG: pyruvate carboxylase subunit B [Candidatus Sumerlaeia bacterium]|nr:pyruvate carboxylase subunit B [Candidatus Sumerlaeia bacterium]